MRTLKIWIKVIKKSSGRIVANTVNGKLSALPVYSLKLEGNEWRGFTSIKAIGNRKRLKQKRKVLTSSTG